MISKFMETLHTKIHEQINDKPHELLKKKTQSLGIDIKECYHKLRLMFLITQHIAHLIDLHVQESRKQCKGKECNINEILKRRLILSNQNQTRNHSIHFTKAVYLHHYLCGPLDIFKSVKFIEEMELQLLTQYQQEEITLETFRDNQNIQQLTNERQFTCICRYEEYEKAERCEKCMKLFHPNCQYQKIVCNRCYLSLYFFPIDSTFYSKFGQKRNTITYFHGKFRCFNTSDNKKSQLFAIKFDIDDFSDLRNANEPEFMIKIMNFRDLSNKSAKLDKWKMQTSQTSDFSMFLNTNRFQFFLNFYQLKRKNLYFRNENSLIFKLENRLPKSKDNILMVKCDSDYFQEEYYEIGIYRISRKKIISSLSSGVDSEDQMILSKQNNSHHYNTFRITTDQFRLLEKYSTRQDQLTKNKEIKSESNKIKSSEQDDSLNKSKSVNSQLVRSYGCNHKQGFKLSELKRNHETLMESQRKVYNKTKQFKSEIEKIIETEIFKQYQLHALRMNIKTEQQLLFNQKNFQRIRQYCINNNLIRLIEMPQLEKYNRNLVNNQLRKYICRYQTKNTDKKKFQRRNRNEELQKEQKKYLKFVKCPICSNYLSLMYLLPYQLKEGEQIKIPRINRNMKRRKEILKQQEAKQSLQEIFRPRDIFDLQKGKKEQQSESYEENDSQESENQTQLHPDELLFDLSNRQIYEDSLEKHQVYSSLLEMSRNQPTKTNQFEQIIIRQQSHEFIQQQSHQSIVTLEKVKINQQKQISMEFKVMSEEQSYSFENECNQQIFLQKNQNIQFKERQNNVQFFIHSQSHEASSSLLPSRQIECEENEKNMIHRKISLPSQQNEQFFINDYQNESKTKYEFKNVHINCQSLEAQFNNQKKNSSNFLIEEQNQYKKQNKISKKIVQISLLSEGEQ